MSRTEPSQSDASQRFEDHLAQVEQAIRRLESQDVPLEDSIDLYAAAMQSLKRCHTVLDGAEKRLEAVRQGMGGAAAAVPADLSESDGIIES